MKTKTCLIVLFVSFLCGTSFAGPSLTKAEIAALDGNIMVLNELPTVRVQIYDVNVSDWDFTIEDRRDDDSVIRFGMGAVKNVGQGPVEAILEGRQGKVFDSLNDFTQRVDLRKVGRRALETIPELLRTHAEVAA